MLFVVSPFQIKDISLTPYVWEHNEEFIDNVPFIPENELPDVVPYMLEHVDHPWIPDVAPSTPLIVDHSQSADSQFNDVAPPTPVVDDVPSIPVIDVLPMNASIQSTVSCCVSFFAFLFF